MGNAPNGTCHDNYAPFLDRVKRLPKFRAPEKVGSFGFLQQFEGDAIVWDNHLAHDPQKDMFEAFGGLMWGPEPRGLKLTLWHGGRPYWKRRDVGLVRAGSLHFQGRQKPIEEQWLKQDLAANPEQWCWCPDRACAAMTCQDSPP